VKIALEKARDTLAEHDRQARAQSDERARRATLFDAKTTQRAELAEQAVDLAARAASRLVEAQLPREASLGAIDAELRELAAREGAALAARGALDDAEEALTSAAETRRAKVEGLARLRADLETLDARLEATKATGADQAQLVTTLDAEIAGEIVALRVDLAERRIAVREPGGALELAAAIEQARALTQQAQAAAEGRRRAEAHERDARSAHEIGRSQHAQAADRRTEQLDAVTQRRADADTAQREMRACLDGADPDALERSLKAEVEAAQLALGRASLCAASSREALAGITAHRQATEAQHAETQVREARASAALARHLAELSLPDAGSLAERLLTDDARKRLIEETSRAREALVAATATRDDAEKRLAAVTATRPRDADAEESSSAEVHARREGLESRRGGLHQKVGHCQAQLEDHQRRTKDLVGVLERVDRVRRECEIWRSLHELIGVGDGERFKEFAQILNLQELIDKANARLKWLAPRYSLTVARTPEGQPRLSFAVRDAHFADAERPPTTLSGGETFLVSLALALALADYRAVEMPIETLLLDEGFGTLDNDTLNTAMDALERLQQRGTQIGIISHLAGLRERIEARIVVGKLGNGRSEIRFELGTDV
jgi:exonuclease SbcC